MTALPKLTPKQVRAARKLLDWSQDRMAAQSGTTAPFVRTYEKEGRLMKIQWLDDSFDGLAAIRVAVEAVGVEFLDESEGGARVSLRLPDAA